MAEPGDILVYEGTIHEALGIRVLEATPDRVVLEMEVGPKVHQPMGLLHGGASGVIAESAASIGAYLNCDPGTQFCVGIELNVNHLRAKRDGTVTATATPVKKGSSIHVWSIQITDVKERQLGPQLGGELRSTIDRHPGGRR
jgi:uncharacterized protein (TIGR00369 family)